MKVVMFGSSLVSAYWNAAATYYRGICKAMHARGHQVVFVEPDLYQRQSHRDLLLAARARTSSRLAILAQAISRTSPRRS